MQADGITPVAGDHTAEATPPSENDYSITLWINWGKFDYITGGDTDGEYDVSQFGYTYNDVETDVAARINQEVEVMWVNHHGSEHSTNATYVNTLDPDVALYGVGSNSFGHPDQRVLDILFNNGTKQYLPQMGDPTRNYHDAVIVNGEVIVQVTNNGDDYTVDGDPYTASDPGGGIRAPNVGEVLINEYLPNNKNPQHRKEYVELYNTTAEELDISGMWLDDITSGGGSPVQIDPGTTILPGGYYVHEFSSYFNNDGDDVTFLASDGTTVHDSHTYTTSAQNQSYCRLPDGGAWSGSYCSPTKGTAN